ncbi:hypothetical protein LT679_00780 [Mucilaginibacter roseus]|uniref:Transposase n=1 Tax=Mucilaginibacter roseus TaxID=1528868 RepID=A0ABS8U044_9SPHI|nr:hypothetical protein [Mucilaginibacter roseus]MCD8739119.1 hypothetical protein [Mucilaginibacter roseus]
MKTTKNVRLRFRFAGELYSVTVNSINYTGSLIVSKLRVGHTQFWLILQNGVWRFVSDMPLCRDLKSILVAKVAGLHGLSTQTADQLSPRNGVLLNAVLSVLAIKKDSFV